MFRFGEVGHEGGSAFINSLGIHCGPGKELIKGSPPPAGNFLSLVPLARPLGSPRRSGGGYKDTKPDASCPALGPLAAASIHQNKGPSARPVIEAFTTPRQSRPHWGTPWLQLAGKEREWRRRSGRTCSGNLFL